MHAPELPFTPLTAKAAPEPLTTTERFDRLRLYRSRRVGALTFHRLIAEHGSATTALEALPDVARNAGARDYQPCPEAVVEAELKMGRRFGATLLVKGDADYPALLSLIEDAPPVLWTKGDLTLLERPTLSIVGARNASSLGLRFARSLAKDLGEEGFAIASGLARGIDSAAHKAALETGTVAVLAGGLDTVYPKENQELYESISRGGLVMSEHGFGMKPLARHFPMRNRIVAGLSRATIVVEAAAKSGSLITAGMALDQGREVMAVPGHPFDGRSSGGNILLRDGAALIRGARDVIDALASASPLAQTQMSAPAEVIAIPEPPRESRSLSDHAALHSDILSRLSTTAVEEDALIRAIGGDPEAAACEILNLELDGRIARKPGGMLALG